MRRLLTGSVLAAVFLLPPGARAAETLGDVTLTLAPTPQGECNHGYTEYAVTVTNQSADRPHEVTLTIPRYSFHPHQDYLQEVSRTVRVGPGATVRVALLHPHRPPLLGNGLAVTIDGRKQERYIDFSPRQSHVGPYGYARRSGGSAGFGAPPPQSFVLLSHGVPNDFLAAGTRTFGPITPAPGSGAMPAPGPGLAEPPLPGGSVGKAPPGARVTRPGAAVKVPGPPVGVGVGGPGRMVGFPAIPPPASGPRFARPEVGVASWSASWLAYSCYDGVILTADELGSAPAGVRTALWQFAETGGTLLVLGEAKVPEGWRLRGGRSSGYDFYDAGFGQAVVAVDGDYRRWPDARWHELREGWARAGAPWGRVRSVVEANDDFPVVDDISVPVRGLFVLMLVFAVAIGPVNMIVLARKNRRLWLLWTVPAISLVTCLAVVGYMLAVEGWHGHRRVAALTLLDGPSHRATTLAWAGFYSPLTPGDGLHFSPNTEVAPQNATEWRYGRPGANAHTLDWGADQHLARGWVQPRVPAHFMLRKSEVRRERVTVARGADGALSVVNGLGVEVHRFWYADEAGRIYTAEDVRPGARAALTPTDVTVREGAGDALRRAYVGDWLRTMTDLPKHPEAYLTPGSYLAEMEAAPLVEEGLAGARAERCWSLVLGTLKGAGDES